MGPRRCGASWLARKMEVGPSAPPMIPMAAASLSVKPSRKAADRAATRMPNWAAAPSMNVTGRASSGRKSVSTPTPRKMMGGSSSVRMPFS
jgi:hypothetical protein